MFAGEETVHTARLASTATRAYLCSAYTMEKDRRKWESRRFQLLGTLLERRQTGPVLLGDAGASIEN